MTFPPARSKIPVRGDDRAPDDPLRRPDPGGPAGAAGAWGGAVLCHPHPLYGGSMHNNVVSRVTAALALAGLAVLRFTFRGVERSRGAYADGVGEQEDVPGVDRRAAPQVSRRQKDGV